MKRSREYADALLRRARDDQYVVTRLGSDPEAPVWAVGFHAQQAVEKAVKAVLTASDVEYARTHNLSFLLGLLEEAGVCAPPGAAGLGKLTPYGTMLRYEAGPEMEPEGALDLDWAAESVRRVIAWADDQLRTTTPDAP